MISPIFSLLITTRNRKNDLFRTLSVMEPLFLPHHEIVVYDDGSIDGTADLVLKHFPGVKLMARRNDSGRGNYLVARHQLFNMARGEFAISLDDDAEMITKDFFSIMSRHFAEHPQCGVIAMNIFWGKYFPSTCKPTVHKFVKVKSFTGCGHVWRMKARRLIPSCPEWFRFYGEEDFSSFHLIKNHWDIHFLPELVVHHRIDHQQRLLNSADRKIRYRNQLAAGLMNMCLFYPLTTLPKSILYAVSIQVWFLFSKKRSKILFLQIVLALLDCIKCFHLILKNRSSLSKSQWNYFQSLASTVTYGNFNYK